MQKDNDRINERFQNLIIINELVKDDLKNNEQKVSRNDIEHCNAICYKIINYFIQPFAKLLFQKQPNVRVSCGRV